MIKKLIAIVLFFNMACMTGCASYDKNPTPVLKSGIFPLLDNDNVTSIAKKHRAKEILKNRTKSKDIYLWFPPIYFDKSSFRIKNEQFPSLNKSVERLKKYSAVKITLVGYCDPDGDMLYNRLLGYDRANSVRQYLFSKGISADRMTTLSGCIDKYRHFDEYAKQRARKVEIVPIKEQ